MQKYNPKTGRYEETDLYGNFVEKTDNAGQLSIGVNTGDLNIGLGGGLTMDLNTGGLGMNIGGMTYDF